MKILIGYDGSECADAALEDLQRAGLPSVAEALVVSVAEEWLPPTSLSSFAVAGETLAEGVLGGVIEARGQVAQAVEAAHARAFQVSKVVQSLFPKWNVNSETHTGSPARQLLTRAEEFQADLIVVGSHGRSALERIFIGSISLRVVTGAICSVRVARHQYKDKNSPVKIIIGIDGSPGSQLAVREVAERAWPEGSEVRLVSSVDPLHMYAIGPDDKFAFAKAIHQAAGTTLREAGLRVSSLIQEEDPKLLLIDEAEKSNADSIFVGARGLNRVERFFLGSVSTAVVARAHCSVEVTREKENICRD